MTHKEENIVNIAMRAAELLQAGMIQRSELTGHAGLTDTIISLAEQFEKQNAGVDFDAEGRDYWLEIDEFAEKQLVKELGVEHIEPSQDLNIKVIIVDGIVEEVLMDQNLPVQVEVVDVDDNYEDYDQLKAYREELYQDPSYQHCMYTVADFKEEAALEDPTGMNRDEDSLCEVVAVVGYTDGGVVFRGTWDECREFCESNQWCYFDQNYFRWELETRDPNEELIPGDFYTAVDHYSRQEGRDIQTDFVRHHADNLVHCWKENLPFENFVLWNSLESLVGEKLTFDEYVVLHDSFCKTTDKQKLQSSDVVDILKESLSSYRSANTPARPSLAAQIKNAAGTASKATGKEQTYDKNQGPSR